MSAEAAAGGAEQSGVAEVANFITVIIKMTEGTPLSGFLHHWENVIFSFIYIIGITTIFHLGSRYGSLIPGRFQCFLEIIVEYLDDMVMNVIGKHFGREFLPFIGSLFLYILVMNLSGLIPGLKAPSSSINTTVGLALCVFVYVQFTAVSKLGLWGFIHHLMGSPNDLVGWIFVPLMFPLHVMGEIIKPVSLSLRLFGNIMGEDALLAAFLMFGVAALNLIHSPVGLPLQFPIMLLAIITSTVQALVFSLLSAIYISTVLPHEEGGHH